MLRVDRFSRLYQYLLLMRLHKPIGSCLLLWPTMLALWLASGGMPDAKNIVIFSIGTLVMRSAGCVVNDIADRNLDNKVARTKMRPLASGKIYVWEAVGIFLILISVALYLVLQLNNLSIYLAVLGASLAVIYPFMKRFTFYPQVVLAVTFGWGVIMAYAAQQGTLSVEAWWLLASVACWIIAFDTQYAMADKADDIKIGIKSTAIRFGKLDQTIIGLLQLTFLSSLAMLGWQKAFGMWFYCGVWISGCLFLYQRYLLKNREPGLCFKAFLNNNYVGFAIFVGTLLDYYS